MRWTREEREEAERLLAHGKTIDEIAIHLGRTPNAVAFQVLSADAAEAFQQETQAAYVQDRSLGWPAARQAAMERDSFQCQLCHAKTDLEVHHIIPYTISRSHALTNLITLCESCHKRVRTLHVEDLLDRRFMERLIAAYVGITGKQVAVTWCKKSQTGHVTVISGSSPSANNVERYRFLRRQDEDEMNIVLRGLLPGPCQMGTLTSRVGEALSENRIQVLLYTKKDSAVKRRLVLRKRVFNPARGQNDIFFELTPAGKERAEKTGPPADAIRP